MTTKFPYRIFSFFMAFLMFFSSTGISMDIHYCGNKIQNFSFFGDAEACGMMEHTQEKESNRSCCQASKKTSKSSCCSAPKQASNSCDIEISKKDCCHNERFTLDNDAEFENPQLTLEQFQQVITAVIILVPNFNLFSVSTEKVIYTHYHPPLLIEEISILYQVFRI